MWHPRSYIVPPGHSGLFMEIFAEKLKRLGLRLISSQFVFKKIKTILRKGRGNLVSFLTLKVSGKLLEISKTSQKTWEKDLLDKNIDRIPIWLGLYYAIVSASSRELRRSSGDEADTPLLSPRRFFPFSSLKSPV